MTVLLVFVGGAIGAPSRYLLDRFIQSRHRFRFPYGTLAVNVIGCFILGIVAGSHWTAHQHALIGTGFCGGLTTFSTFSVETVDLMHGRRSWSWSWWSSLVYLAASCALGIGAAAVGFALN
jgi:CrcB protein